MNRNGARFLTGVLLPGLYLWALSSTAFAQTNGTWSGNLSGNWSDTTNWTGGVVASGTNGIAQFNVDISTTRTVTLDTNRTIGYILFGDNGGLGSSWVLSGPTTLTLATTSGAPVITASTNATIGLTLAGTKGFTKNGDATLTLLGDNIYAGTTTIDAGTLAIGNGGTSGRVQGNVADFANLAFNRADDLTYGGIIYGSGSVEKLGGGTLFLTGNNIYTGATTVRGGALNATDGVGLSAASNLVLDGGVLESHGTLTRALGSAGGQLRWAGDGGFSAQGGDLNVRLGGGTSTVTWGSGNFVPGTAALMLGSATADGVVKLENDIDLAGAVRDVRVLDNSSVSTDRAELSGVISNGGLSIDGGGTLVLSGANSYTGGTVIRNAFARAADGGGLPSGGVLRFNASSSSGGGVLESAGVFSRSLGTGAGQVNWMSGGSGGFAAVGGALSVQLNGGSSTVTWNGGNFVDAGGTLVFGSRSADNVVTFANDLDLNFAARTVYVHDNASSTTDAAVLAGVIGNGGLVKEGAGRLILAGDNDYALGTTISAGTLQIGDGGASGALGTGPVADNGALEFNRTGTLSFGGAVTGTGGVTLSGPGTVVLTADNGYTGGTTLTAGVLQLGTGGSTGSIVGDMTNNAALVVNRSNQLTFTGVISGAGTLQQAGTGTTVLLGTNTFSGTTTISAGTLQLGDGGTAGSLASAGIFNSGVLVANRSDTLTIAGIISGTGALRQAGTGTTVLTGDNTYSGITTIASGRLQLGAGGATGSLAGNVADAGVLAIARSNTLAFGGVVSGTGSVAVLGGTFAVTGANTYTGGTTISSGAVLQLGDGGTGGSVAGSIANFGTLVLNRNAAYTLTNTISGAAGSLRIETGNVTLSAANSYGGGTTLNGGSLMLAANTALGTGSLSINGASTLSALNTSTISNGVLLNAPSLTIGGSSNLTFSGAFTNANGNAVLTVNNTGLTTLSNLVLAGTNQAGALTLGGSGTIKILKIVDGAGSDPDGLIVDGTGTFRFEMSNTYTGPTKIYSGTVLLDTIFSSADQPFGFPTGLLTLGRDGGTESIQLASFGSQSNPVKNDIDIRPGSGAITLGGSTDGSTVTFFGDITLGRTIFVSAGTNGFTQFEAPITGAGGLIKVGAGYAQFSGLMTYSGGTTVLGGALVIGNGSNRNGDYNGDIANFSKVVFELQNNELYTGTISGTGSVVVGDGLTFVGAQTYTGGTTVSDFGELRLGNGGAGGTIVGDVALDNGTLSFNRLGTNTFAGNITGSGDIYVGNTTGGTTVLIGNNTFTGRTIVDNGVLRLDSATALADNGDLWIRGAGLARLNGFSIRTVNLLDNGDAGGTLENGAASDVVFTVQAGNFSGTIQDGGIGKLGLRVTGPNTLLLEHANFYTGGTTIEGGTVRLAADGALGTSAVTLAGGALASDSSPRTVSNDINLIGSGAGMGTLSGTGALSLTGVTTLIVPEGSITTTTGGSQPTEGFGTLFITNTAGVTLGNVVLSNNANIGHLELNVTSSAITATVGGVISHGSAPGSTLEKWGAGTVVLTGDNTYSGVTTVAQGTLQIGNGTTGSVLSPTITVSNGATLVFNRSDTLTVGGVIRGAGTVRKNGSGTTIFSGANTYTGVTTVATGTLQLGDGGTTGTVISQTISVSSGATLAVNRSDALTLTAVIAGNGGLRQAGTGTTIITGTNSYGGVTTVSAGTLQIGNGGNAGQISSSNGIVDNGRVVFNRSDLSFYNGVISGTGSLIQAGTGTLLLVGNSSFSGLTTISAGTIQLGNNSTAGAVNGDIVNNSMLAINRSNSYTYFGVISGTGALNHLGANTTIFTGNSTYSGVTTISAGTLQLGIGAGGGIAGVIGPGDIVNRGVLVVNRSNAVTLTGNISGTGAVQKIGTGTLTLAGTNTYSGVTTVGAGAIRAVDGFGLSSATNLTLSGGTLESSGAFTRSLGTGAGQVNFVHGGGFAAFGDDLTVNLGGVGAEVAFDAPGFVSGADSLTFGSGTADHRTIFVNGINLAGGSRTVLAVDNGSSSNDSTVLAGVIRNGGLTFSGGTVILSAANTYAGGTTIVSGTLQLGDGGSTGSITGDVFGAANGGVLAFNRSDDVIFSGNITGSAGVRVMNAAAVELQGTNDYTGGTTISTGVLRAVDGASLSIAGRLQLQNGGRLETNGTFTRSLGTGAGQISWISSGGFSAFGGGLTVNIGGAGTTLTYNSANFLTAGGVFTFGSASADHRTVVVNGLDMNGIARTISVTDNTASTDDVVEFTGVLQNGGLSFVGGTVILTGSNTYAGGTSIVGGVVRAVEGVGLPSAGNVRLFDGILESHGTFARSLGATSGLVRFVGGGGFSAYGGDLAVDLAAPLTWGGPYFVADGSELKFNTVLSDSVVELTNDLDLNGAVRTIFVDDNPETFADYARLSGILSDGGVLKTGTGELVLTAHNTYTGGTTIDAGTIRIASGGEIRLEGNVNILSGATFRVDAGANLLGDGAVIGTGHFINNGTYGGDVLAQSGALIQGNGTIGGQVTIEAGATLSPGNSVGHMTIGSLTLNSSTTDPSVAVFEFRNVDGLNDDFLNSDWDSIQVSTLVLNATAAAPMELKIDSWRSDNSGHGPSDFDPLGSYHWLWIDSASTSLLGSDPVDSRFLINDDELGSGVFGFGNPYSRPTGFEFSVSLVGNALYINYGNSAIPEPGSFLLAAVAAAGLYRRRRLRRRKANTLNVGTGDSPE